MKPTPILLSVLMAWVAFAVDARVIVTQPPIVSMNVPKQAQTQAIALQKLAVDVEILPVLAQTQLTMTFYNPNHRPLEGELVVPLAEGQKITAMALDINGEMRAAVPVPKAKGQQVFEAVERRQVDPALLEQISGNQFRLRVYPIPAQGTRTVSITVSQALSHQDGRLVYQLPVRFGKVGNAHIRVNSSLNSAESFQLPTGFQSEAKPNGGFVAQAKGMGQGLERVLTWQFATPKTTQVLWQNVGNERYFLASIPVKNETYTRRPPLHLGIVWDASLSRRDADLSTQLAVLAAYFKAMPDADVSVQILRGTGSDDVRTYRIKQGDWAQLRKDLTGVVYDGSSSLAHMRPVKGTDEYWVFSDGMDNVFVQALADLQGARVSVFNPQSVANHNALRQMAESHGGVYAPWHDAQTAQRVLQQLWQEQPHITGVTGDVEEVVWPSVRGQDQVITLLGKMKSGVAAPRLQVTLGDAQGIQDISVPLTGQKNAAVPVLWASAAIDKWLSNGERQHEDVLALGKRFGVVSPETSLLVLDDVADYVTHDIDPPPSLQAEYRRLQHQKQQQQQEVTLNQVQQARSDWQAFGEWWNTDFPKNKPKPSKPEVNGQEAQLDMATAAAPMALSRSRASTEAVAADAALEQDASVSKNKADADKQVSIAIQAYQDNSPAVARVRAADKASVYAVYLEERAANLNNPSFYLAASDALWEKGLPTEAVRVASNLAEMKLENRYVLRLLGQQFVQFKRPELAVDVYRQVLRMAPEEPQSYRDLALAEAENGQYQAAAEHLYTIIQKPWDGRFGGIQLIAVDELNQLVAAHKNQITTAQFDAALLHNRPVDMRVVLTWDSDNSDMDLWVTDPNGEKVFYGHQQSYQGGKISRDFTGGYGPEVFWLKDPKAGEYEIRAHFYGDRQQIVTGPTTAHVRLIRHWGKPNQSEQILRVKMAQEREGHSNQESVLIGTFTVQ